MGELQSKRIGGPHDPQADIAGQGPSVVGHLAQEISKRYPSAIANSTEPLVSPRRRFEVLEKVFAGARQFNQEHKLGWLVQRSAWEAP